MLTELALVLLATAVGVMAGIITGLTPGVHINMVSAILLSLAPVIALQFPLVLVSVLIVAMSLTHTFLDTIPSVFLGAPDEADVLGVLPGHRYLLQGNGLMAVKLAAIGGVAGSLVAVASFVPFIAFTSWLYAVIRPMLFWVMLCVSAFMVLHDKKILLALLIFTWSGLLGVVVLRLPMQEPLFPLLSGMFGCATLIYSINEHQSIPQQKNLNYTDIDIPKSASGTIRGVLAGFLTALLPGISAAAASAIASLQSKMGDHGFMVLLGSLGSASFILSLAAFIGIEKARNGAMAVITQLHAMPSSVVVLLLSTALIATGMAAILTVGFARTAAEWLPRIPYGATCIAVLVFVTAMVAWRTGPLGVLVLITSTAVGLLPAILKTGRAQAMGCMMLPLLVLLW